MSTETTTTTTPAIDGPATVNAPPDTRPDDCLGTTTRWTLQPCGDHPDAPQPAVEIEVGVIVPDEPLTYPPQAPEATVTASTVQVQPPTLPETGTSPYAPQIGVIGTLSIIIGTMLAVTARSTK